MSAYKKIKALGTEIEIWLHDSSSRDFETDLFEMETVITNFEKRFSRFSDDSEISQLNKSTGPFLSSSELINILLLAKDFYNITGGIFDPSILPILESLGYKESFPFAIPETKIIITPTEINFQKIIIDEKTKTITKPPHIRIDLGGIGKGYLVDKLAKIAKAKTYENFLISGGGDMFVLGLDNDKQKQLIGVQNPLDFDKDILQIQIPETGKAIATSGSAKRHWTKNGRHYHHLIDPRISLSTDNNLLAVTIIADSVIEADIFAKTVFILGQEQGQNFINENNHIEGILINKSNKIILSKNMSKYLVEKECLFE